MKYYCPDCGILNPAVGNLIQAVQEVLEQNHMSKILGGEALKEAFEAVSK